MKTYNLIFDIAARQSGKTTRLIQNVVRHICSSSGYSGGTGLDNVTNYDNKAVVIAPNYLMALSIQKKA